MINQLSNLNWLSILLAFLAYFVLGGTWFTLLFKKSYAKSLGKENQLPEKPGIIFILGPAICCLLITITTAIFIYTLNISTINGALEFAIVAGLGYLVANTVNIAINPNIPRPIFYGTISGAYHMVGIVIVSLILVAMK